MHDDDASHHDGAPADGGEERIRGGRIGFEEGADKNLDRGGVPFHDDHRGYVLSRLHRLREVVLIDIHLENHTSMMVTRAASRRR